MDTLTDVSFSAALGRVAMGGANCVRVLDASGSDYGEIKSDAVDLDPNQAVEKVGWTRDGQVRAPGAFAVRACAAAAAAAWRRSGWGGVGWQLWAPTSSPSPPVSPHPHTGPTQSPSQAPQHNSPPFPPPGSSPSPPPPGSHPACPDTTRRATPQVLTVGTHNGYLHTYLASLPMVFDYAGNRVLYLTSLLEMTVMDVNRRNAVARIELETEPAFCGLGPSHAAVGMNNQVSCACGDVRVRVAACAHLCA